MIKKKNDTTMESNVWDDNFDSTKEFTKAIESETPDISAVKPVKKTKATSTLEYDIDGLMTDFPTAKELERFVYDETGVVLNLKGRANKLKYQIAMDALNGEDIDEKFIGVENPYVDKADLIPTENLQPKPNRDPNLPPRSTQQNAFYSPIIPHPDADARAQNKKVQMMFRKYSNGMISYEILGPLETKPYGEKIDKYGRSRPEIIKWIDPRTGEQTVMREDGTLTPQGKRLRATMQTFKVNKSNQWEVWIDREFISLNDTVAHNPWDLSK